VVKVKICGITNRRDAALAADYGADAVGFVFAKSPRRIALAEAIRIGRWLGPWIATVGVFVNEDSRTVRRIAALCRLTAVQLHGDEPASYVKGLSPLRTIKAFRVAKAGDLKGLTTHPADAFLFDTKTADVYGGTGKTFDWSLLEKKIISKPFIVSGGLGPGNVAGVVRRLAPYGVDVSSGVEKSPGKKDARLVKEFIQNAKK